MFNVSGNLVRRKHVVQPITAANTSPLIEQDEYGIRQTLQACKVKLQHLPAQLFMHSQNFRRLPVEIQTGNMREQRK